MVVGCSQQETLNLYFVLVGTRQQGVPVIVWELTLPDGFNPVSPSFTVRDVTRDPKHQWEDSKKQCQMK
ncbi:unnamed protein product [Schistosoma margrebowiei]|uniref:Uncharacterized protein n=1 Tax=Schistosoma margrebowiei TaxID=48269 RepID=A0A183LP93_9TREM|nr:unnamed protein product [Schistosoma margrebowiei]